jgi:hypothetical protein
VLSAGSSGPSKPDDRGAGTLAGMRDLRTNYRQKAERVVAAVLAGATD